MENLYEIAPGGAVNFSIAFEATDTTKTLYFDPTRVSRIYPYFYRGFLTIPDWTNAVTLAATFTDSADGNTKTLNSTYTALAKNGVRELAGITVEVPNRVALTLTLSGAPGGSGGTIYGTLYSTENASGASSSVGPIVTETNSGSIKTAVEQLTEETTGCATDDQNTITLPANTALPAEIDTTTTGLLEVCLTIAHDFEYCFAANATAGLARFGAGTVCTCPPGIKTIPIKGCTNKLYVRSADAVADVIGLDWVEEAV